MTDAANEEREARQAVWAFRLAAALVVSPAIGLWILVAWLLGRILFGQVPITLGAFVAPAGFAIFAVLATLLAYVPLVRRSQKREG